LVTEIELLKKELAAAKSEIRDLKLQLANVTVLLRKEMIASGRLPKSANENGDSVSQP
jgi:hypothetical protein